MRPSRPSSSDNEADTRGDASGVFDVRDVMYRNIAGLGRDSTLKTVPGLGGSIKIDTKPGKVQIDGQAVAFELKVVKIVKHSSAGAGASKALQASAAGRRALIGAGLAPLGWAEPAVED